MNKANNLNSKISTWTGSKEELLEQLIIIASGESSGDDYLNFVFYSISKLLNLE